MTRRVPTIVAATVRAPQALRATLIGVLLLVGGAAAAGAERTALDACVAAHIGPADISTMRRLMTLAMLKSADNAEEFGVTLSQAKHDQIIDGVAKLLSRLGEQDCKAEVRAYVATAPVGGAFGALIQVLNQRTQTVLQPQLVRAGAMAGVEVIQKLDPAVMVDIGVDTGRLASDNAPPPPPSVAPPPAMPSPAAGLKRVAKSALSGVKLRLAFDTALNPDCSSVGKTVIRVTLAPAHGTATVEDGTGYSGFDEKNQRYHCNEQKSNGAILWYQSEKGYAGPDTLSYQVIYPTGGTREATVDLTVN